MPSLAPPSIRANEPSVHGAVITEGTNLVPANARSTVRPFLPSYGDSTDRGELCLLLSIYCCPAAPTYRRVGAERKCRLHAWSDYRVKATRLCGSINALPVSMKDGLRCGLPTLRSKDRLGFAAPPNSAEAMRTTCL